MTYHKDLHGQDLHDAKFKTGTTSPVGVFAADVIGLGFFDTVSGQLWLSTGLGINDWVAVSSYDPFESVSFDYLTPTPLDFGTLSINDIMVQVSISIITPFDDAATILSFGLVSNPGNILPSNMIDPTAIGTYHAGENVSIGGADQFRLQILPGTSTQGAGKVVAVVRK
jgi:hypothetical protein